MKTSKNSSSQSLDVLTNEKRYGDIENKPISPDKNSDLKVLVISWNMMGKLPSQKTLEILLSRERTSADLIVIGTQECQTSLLVSFFCKSKDSWEKMLCDFLKQKKFQVVQSQKLHGLHIIAFVRDNKKHLVSSLKTKKVKTGWYGLLGNKGAVSLNLMLGNQSHLFINTHLPSSHKQCYERNDHLMQIVDKLMDKERRQNVILFGDMNYRLNVTGLESRSICALNQDKQLSYQQFACKDQLTQQKQLQFFLKLFKQQPITFPPTYKLSTDDNTYDHNRITGWTDRIFYSNGGNCKIRQDQYYSDMYVLGSDHRPVFGVFTLKNAWAAQTVEQPKQSCKFMKRCLFF